MSDIEEAFLAGRGRLGDMSREGLLEVIAYLSQELQRYQAPDMIHARALGQVEMVKRGLA